MSSENAHQVLIHLMDSVMKQEGTVLEEATAITPLENALVLKAFLGLNATN